MKIIGRKKEQAILGEAFKSNKAEFIALYGRRRVGKTYLIKNYFSQLSCTFVYISGMKDGTLQQQLRNFADALEEVLIPGLGTPKHWMDAFKIFTSFLEKVSQSEKIVLFLDELPWLVTKKSLFLQALDYYWNRYWSHDKRIKLIVCGSAASWIIKNIIHNKGGLYNRITRQFRLDPFSLKETEEFLLSNHVRLKRQQIAEIYMVAGGIPYYLAQIQKGLSAAQNIETLAFHRDGVLYQDFEILFASLFDQVELYTKIVRIISQYRYGINQEELFQKCEELSKGGRAIARLRDLEETGFIISFLPPGHKRRGVYYRVIDEYVQFYLSWIEPFKGSAQKLDQTSWLRLRESSSWKAWAGYTFETICFKHIAQIRRALKIDPSAIAFTWKHDGKKDDEQGAQIDLLFDRPDDALTICEIKYTDKPFKIDKECFQNLRNKVELYEKVTNSKKQVFLTFVASSGLHKNIYSEEYISSIATLDDLFKQE